MENVKFCCGEKMQIRNGKYGKFFFCKLCKFTKSLIKIDEDNKKLYDDDIDTFNEEAFRDCYYDIGGN